MSWARKRTSCFTSSAAKWYENAMEDKVFAVEDATPQFLSSLGCLREVFTTASSLSVGVLCVRVATMQFAG